MIDGEVIGSFDSYTGSIFNTFDIAGKEVETLALTGTDLDEDEWISLLEVCGRARKSRHTNAGTVLDCSSRIYPSFLTRLNFGEPYKTHL